jgi:hypothetical protein
MLISIVALGLIAAASPGSAAIVPTNVNDNISTTPFTLNLGTGDTLVFSSDSSAFEGAIGVQTTGATEVFSSFGAPAEFEPYATTLFPSERLGSFAAYSSPAGIPYSLSVGTVGFEYTSGGNTYYGLASIGGSTVYGYEVDTTPGGNLGLAVPEPAAWTLLLIGFGALGAAARASRRRQQSALLA